MRIVIDLQGAQSESRFRGIGRYSLSIAKAIAKNRGDNEVIIALSGLFPDSIEPIRSEFRGILPHENIRVWYALGPVMEKNAENKKRRKMAELIREAFLQSLAPDVIIITSLFEGYIDDAVTSIGLFDMKTPVAVILYDLIPYSDWAYYLDPYPEYKSFYMKKIEYLKKARFLLAISEYSSDEAVRLLNIDKDKCINISAACNKSFKPVKVDEKKIAELKNKFQITKKIILCVPGGFDERKNIPNLLAAFAGLPGRIRERYQLVIASRVPEGNLVQLREVLKKLSLSSKGVIITGYLSDSDLVAMYNICDIFVFPSLSEGFGLPALEALSCGASVIGSNATSLPEVIGLEEALFDPNSIDSIAEKIVCAIENTEFNRKLKEHSLVQASKFSWDKSAKIAIEFLERVQKNKIFLKNRYTNIVKTSIFNKKILNILIVKLDHMGDFILSIPAISKIRARYPYAKLDVVVGSWNVEIAESLKFFEEIFIFDFFKQKSFESAELENESFMTLIEKLNKKRYDIVIDLRRQSDTRFFIKKLNAKTKIGYSLFDEGIDEDLDLALKACLDVPGDKTKFNVTPVSLQLLRLADVLPEDVNNYLFFPSFSKFNCSKNAGFIAIFPNAGNPVREWGDNRYAELIKLLSNEVWAEEIRVFSNDDRILEYSSISDKVKPHIGLGFRELTQVLAECGICISNNSFGAHIASYMGLISLGIYSGHETPEEWGAPFGQSFVIYNKVFCSPCHIPDVESCKNYFKCLDILPEDVFSVVSYFMNYLNDKNYCEQAELSIYSGATESERSFENIASDLVEGIKYYLKYLPREELVQISNLISFDLRVRKQKRIFIDISELVLRDAKSGIQRVTKNIFKNLLVKVPDGFCVEPICATPESHGYFFAREFAAKEFGASYYDPDGPIDPVAGDIFLGLDLTLQTTAAQLKNLLFLKQAGVRIFFVVYDLLPITFPDCFVDGTKEAFMKWLETVVQFDGAICISKAVSEELAGLIEKMPMKNELFKNTWFHLGSDINFFKKNERSADPLLLKDIKFDIPSFLMVGTIEPRKAYEQVINAFEYIWSEGNEVNLIIVGKAGWLMDDFISRISNHPELNRRLFWLQGISDEYLERVYDSSQCLIMASNGEGFGLPIVEAARHKIPIIARDIPVFREIAGESAFYFHNSDEPSVLSEAILKWLEMFHKNTHPKPDGIDILTWSESAEMLLDRILKLM